jgi:hypothetical protein
MSPACAAQLAQLRVDLVGELIPLYDDDEQCVLCFVPARSAPSHRAWPVVPARSASSRRAWPDWEPVTTPVLLHLDGTRCRALIDHEAALVAREMAARTS